MEETYRLTAPSTDHFCNEDIFSRFIETKCVQGTNTAMFIDHFLYIGYGDCIIQEPTIASIRNDLPYLPYIARRVIIGSTLNNGLILTISEIFVGIKCSVACEVLCK